MDHLNENESGHDHGDPPGGTSDVPMGPFPVGQFIFPTILDPKLIRKYVAKLPLPKKLIPNYMEKNPAKDLGHINYYDIEMIELRTNFHPDIPPTKIWLYRQVSSCCNHRKYSQYIHLVNKNIFNSHGSHDSNNTHNNACDCNPCKCCKCDNCTCDPCHCCKCGTSQAPYSSDPTNPLIEIAMLDQAIVKWINNLPHKHLLEDYIDYTLHGAHPGTPDVRTTVHLHGGVQAPSSDGFPDDWWLPGKHKIYHYFAQDPPCMLFWHDHTIGITRLNVYAGLGGGVYLIRDPMIETSLNLPKGSYEIPLVITDRTFDVDGQLVYSTSNSSSFHPKWKSSFLGNTICVNNAIWPYLKVHANKYRFRIVNASDTRTYTLRLVLADNFAINGPAFYQIGTDDGYLPNPIKLDSITLASAERADVIIDFSDVYPGAEFIMLNTANAPFPNGNSPDPATVGQIMKIIVKPLYDNKHFRIATPSNFKSIDPTTAIVTRQLILEVNSVIPQQPINLLLQNLTFDKTVTETPVVGTTEIWELINLSNGMHPIHIHLINFQLINRQKFDVKEYIAALRAANPIIIPGEGIPHQLSVNPYLIGEPISSEGTNEEGYKDVIQVPGGQVTRLIMQFSPRSDANYNFDPTNGEYVWHCHIISHEDNDMMRPMQLIC